jgi:hypothetical protein
MIMKTFLEMLATKGLKDPTKKARPMRVTLAMVQAEGAFRDYPAALVDHVIQNDADGVEIDCDVTWTTDEYVGLYCSMNILKVTS